MIDLLFQQKKDNNFLVTTVKCSLLEHELVLKIKLNENSLSVKDQTLTIPLSSLDLKSLIKILDKRTMAQLIILSNYDYQCYFFEPKHKEKLYRFSIDKVSKKVSSLILDEHTFIFSPQGYFSLRNYLNKILAKIGEKRLIFQNESIKIFTQKNKLIIQGLDNKKIYIECFTKLEKLPKVFSEENIISFINEHCKNFTIINFENDPKILIHETEYESYKINKINLSKITQDIYHQLNFYQTLVSEVLDVDYYQLLENF